jgi:hypothetical protein
MCSVPLRLGFAGRLFPLGFETTQFYVSHLPLAWFMFYPPFSCFDFPANIWRSVQFIVSLFNILMSRSFWLFALKLSQPSVFPSGERQIRKATVDAFMIFVHSELHTRIYNCRINRDCICKWLSFNIHITGFVNLSRNRRSLIIWLRSVRLRTDCSSL